MEGSNKIKLAETPPAKPYNHLKLQSIMKKNILFPLLALLWLLSTPVFSWNANGHIVISQLAYERLTPSTRKQVDQLSAQLFKQLPFSTQYELNHKYPEASEFAKLSLLPDRFRTQPLGIIFEQYQGKLPEVLQPLAKNNTRYWHFISRTYPPNRQCSMNGPKDNLIWAIRTLKPIVKYEKDPISQGLALILLTHLIADIHQPLHTFSYVKANCKTDKGGNAFCLSPKKKGKYCRHNLHHLWDTCVGFLRGKQPNLARKMVLIAEGFPATRFKEETIETHPETWIKQNYTYAGFIYSIKPNQKPYRQYYKKGQYIAKQQMAIASYRLAYTINTLFDSAS